MLPSCSRILVEAINTMATQWVAYDQVVCGWNDTAVIRVVILQHAKVKNLSRILTDRKQDTPTRHHHPHKTIKALHSRKIVRLGFLSLPYWF